MYPAPLRYSPMTFRTLEIEWPAFPGHLPIYAYGSRVPRLKPWVPAPMLPKKFLSPSSPIPALPSHGANVPAWTWPVLFFMEMSNAKGLVSPQCALLYSLVGDRDTVWKALHCQPQPWSLSSPAFRELLARACLLFTVKNTMPVNKAIQ